MTRDQRQQGRYLDGKLPPFGWKVGETCELIAVPEQQAAIRRMRKLKDDQVSRAAPSPTP